MAQNSVNYGNNPTGPELLDDYLAKEQENILTSNSGIQRPSYATAGMFWLDTSVTPWLYKIYDGSNDAVVGIVNPTTHKFIVDTIDDSNLVHKTIMETITGYKTLKSDNTGLNPLGLLCDTIDVSQTQNAYNDVIVYDTNNSVIGSYSFFQNNSGEYGFNFKIDNQGGAGYDLRFYKGTDNLNHVKLPTPTEDTTSSLEADTVGARNTKLNNKFPVVSTLPANPDNDTFYFVTGA